MSPWIERKRECIHPGLLGVAMSVAFGSIGVGSRWRCDRCPQEWTVVRGAEGRRVLEKSR